MDTWVADFETTTNPEKSYVWAWACCQVGDLENIYIGTDIYDFMDWCQTRPENVKVYFHNLKFDGNFIISWLLKNEFRHVASSRDRASNTFKTMISDEGVFYGIEVIFWKRGKSIKKVSFYDSMKLLPMSAAKVAKSFHMPYEKGIIDYDRHNNLPYGSPLTQEEHDYIINDVKIMAYAMNELKKQGLDKLTIGSCAMAEYKSIVGDRTFKRYFPQLSCHNYVKQAYGGGWAYLNPAFKGKLVKNGIALDVNSLFPFVMRTKSLPNGMPLYFSGEYQDDRLYPLYVQTFRCQFELKPGKLPTVRAKRFFGNEYLTTSDDHEITMCLNSVDLKLFLENYDVYNMEYIEGWKFMAKDGMFDEYIDKWDEAKRQAKKEGNWGLYIVAKLFLNSLYGKFGANTTRRSKAPYLEDGIVRYEDLPPETVEGVYVPVASFVTSYAREYTIRAAQKIMDDNAAGKSKIQFIYSDTDSLYLSSPDFSLPDGLDIDQYRLGAWKVEGRFNKAKFLRPKCYIANYTEDMLSAKPQYKLKRTIAGMPEECHDQVTFSNFKFGAVYSGKKAPKVVPGGVILENIEFTIKE